MPVPVFDILCRFVRPKDWSKTDNRPKPAAFKQADLSVWHKDKLLARHVRLEDLRIEHLTGYGQAHHTTGDFLQFATEAGQIENCEFSVQVEWRPEEKYVAEPWRRWNYAHVQVEAVEGPKNFLVEFRRKLSLNARVVIPPDR